MDVSFSRSDWLAGLATAIVVSLFAMLLAGFYVPAYSGTDENGYLCSARRLALTGDSAKHTAHPLEHVSVNVVQVKPATYYAKYPLWYPWLCAAAYRLGGPAAAFLVSPILAALALVGIFFLARSMVGAFAGVLATVLLATNPLHASFGLSGLSHAAAVCFAVWAMFFLWRWTEQGGWVNAAMAGGLAAYTYTIRYSEALLALPVVAMVVWRYVGLPEGATPTDRTVRVRQWRQEVLALVTGAVVAAGPLWIHHWVAFGAPWKNGYDLCGESTGFSWKWFQENWWNMLTRLNTPGLLLVFPLGLAGLAYVAVRTPKRGTLLGLWLVPAVLMYTAYYWAPQGDGRGYIRFFVSVFPAFIVCALALLTESVKPRAAWSVALGAFVAMVATYNLRETLPGLQELAGRHAIVARTWDVLRDRVPAHALLVGSDGLLNNLEFAGDYELYSHENFDRKALTKHLKVLDDNEPHPFQRDKARTLAQTIGKMNDNQLVNLQRSLLATNVVAGRPVLVVGTREQFRSARGRLGETFRYEPVTEWLQVQFPKSNETRQTTWVLYRLELRAAGDNGTNTVTGLEEEIDQLQFRLRLQRDNFAANYPEAQVALAAIKDNEQKLQELNAKAKPLAPAKKKGTRK